MLEINRRLGETIQIGDSITVTIIGLRDGQVRLGIKAPRTVSIDREELYLQKKGSRKATPPVPGDKDRS